ncbi:MAG: hypothetical protein ACYC2T_05045 [Bacillota bacterium]
MSEVITAFQYEELYTCRAMLETMWAIKKLAEAGLRTDRFPYIEYEFYMDGCMTVLYHYLGIEASDPTKPENAEGEENEYEDDEYLPVWLACPEDRAPEVLDAVVDTIGGSVIDTFWDQDWVKIIFYPGYLPDPSIMDGVMFVIRALKVLDEKGGAINGDSPGN